MNSDRKLFILLFCFWLIAASVLIAHFFFIELPYVRKISAENRIRYDTSEISGRLLYVKQELTNGNAFVMENEPEKLYSGVIRFLGDDSGKNFRYVAEPGDSVIKKRYSDTLILIKKDITYYCLCVHE